MYTSEASFCKAALNKCKIAFQVFTQVSDNPHGLFNLWIVSQNNWNQNFQLQIDTCSPSW